MSRTLLNAPRRVLVMAMAAVLAAAATSCRHDPLAPPAPSVTPPLAATALRAPIDDEEPRLEPVAGVPAISDLHTQWRRDSIVIRGRLLNPPRSCLYGPDDVGRWAIQILVDTDSRIGGYWLGFDYVVRGGEWSSDEGTFVIRRITLDPGTPGGWGPDVGRARFVQRPRDFEVVIPREAIGAHGPRVFLVVETFATVECPFCESGATHAWIESLFHSTTDPRYRDLDPIAARQRRAVTEAARPRGVHATLDAQPHLAGSLRRGS